MQSQQALQLRSQTAQHMPRIITSGKQEIAMIIKSQLQAGVPEENLYGLFQELGLEVYRSEYDDLNNHQ